MASAFHPSLLLARGIRSTGTNGNSMILNPESDVMPASPKRKSRAGSIVRKRLSSVSKLAKKKKSSSSNNNKINDDGLPEQAPLVLRPRKAAKKSPLLRWMEKACPQDVVPKILAYCGPQITTTLFQCNRFWHQLISSERTWRVLCEELYKWSDGDEEPTDGWREHYRLNPCVPTDYTNINDAVAVVCPSAVSDSPSNNYRYAKKEDLPARTIWLRPQEHRLQESLMVQAIDANVTLETMTTTKKKRRQPLASLLLQTRRRNKPLLHVAAGHVTLRKLRLGHYCGGFNLWNGNAAVQIQPIVEPNDDNFNVEPPEVLPSATLLEVEVISHSGRGIVINDGGNVQIAHSYIHDCAATGIYVGSHECRLTLEHSDLIANGHGNQLAASVRASGVSRGHSGFYLENGHAKLHQVNISNNSSCGISVSSVESRLLLDNSDVVANGHSNQVEVAFGSQQMGATNNVARTGLVKVRSRLGLQSCCGSANDGPRRRSGSSGSFNEEDMLSETEAEEEEDDLEHLQDSFVVAEENVRFGELIEI